jgi:hypothetical protein
LSAVENGKRVTWPSLPLPQWPEGDRQAWLANTERGRRHRRPLRADRYADASLRKFYQGYSRWLGFLAHRGWLDGARTPGQCITEERLDAFFDGLLAAGNADHTVVGRFSELAAALALLEPGTDWRWVRGPRGGVIPRHLRVRRQLVVPHPRVLYRWGCTLMDTASGASSSLAAALKFRDGLIIAIEAARARRLRSMAGLQVRTELIRQPDGRWGIDLPPSRVKTRKSDSFLLPIHLTPYVDRYLGEVRPFLLRGRESSAMWIGNNGQDLSQKTYGEMYGLRATQRFKIRFGPHRNRHAAATASAIDAPHDPTLAARMMGITPGVVGEAYNRAGQAGAAKGFNKLIEALQHEAIVRMGYRQRRPHPRPEPSAAGDCT